MSRCPRFGKVCRAVTRLMIALPMPLSKALMPIDSSFQRAAPLYVQIAEELRANIQAGAYAVGDRLPTEVDLSRRFGVNRHTLRRAVEILRHEGLLRVDRGRGTFVTAAPVTLSIGQRVRYNEMLKAQGLRPSEQTLRVLELSTDAATSHALGCAPGASAVLLERLSLVNGVPISLSSKYFPSSLMPQLMEHCRRYQSISAMVQEQYGFDHLRRSTRISAQAVQPRDARLLEVPLNAPILLTEAINVNQAGQVIEYGVTRFRSDRMELVFETALAR